MTVDSTNPRALATRVAKALRDKGRTAEAVRALCAWAASGPDDAAGRALLAEALRIEPQSAVAKMAFERMQGVTTSEQSELDEAIAQYTAEELARLDRERRPIFQRAQVGFNNNVKYKGRLFHVQTEDSGLNQPHVITHLFADGGRIIKSHKRSYAGAVEREDVAAHVRALMKGQHMEMLAALRDGQLDAIIDGRRAGGVELLDFPPVVEVGRVGGARGKVSPSRAPRDQAKVRVTLHVLRSLAGGPERYDPPGDTVIIGSEGAVPLPGERFCHPREAMLVWDGERLWLEDLEGGNGVFLRIRTRVEIGVGSEFVVGDSLLRLERNPDPNDGPDDGPTYFFSSVKWPSAFRVAQILEGGLVGACSMAHDSVLQIGSAHEYANDLLLPYDPLVSRYHAVIEEQADVFVLTDLGARSGVFVRVTGRQALSHGDELLVGRTRLLVDLERRPK